MSQNAAPLTVSLATNPALRAKVTESLQKKVDQFYSEHKAQQRMIRWNLPLRNAQGIDIAPALLTDFRVIATKLDSQMEFAKTADIIAYVRIALPELNVYPDDLTLTSFPATAARQYTNRQTGAIVDQPARKAQVVASFGAPEKNMSPQAKLQNAQAEAQWAEIFSSVAAPAPETTSADAL